MTWWSRLQTDLRCSDTHIGREERPFLVLAAVGLVAAAQVSEPGGPAEFASLIVAACGVVGRGLFPRLPSEVLLVVVVGGVALAVGQAGQLEVGQFLIVLMVLYAAWHTGSQARAVAMTVLAAGTPWFLAVVRNVDMGWVPWSAASVFMFVLGRNLRRQRQLIEDLTATRQALADAAVASERQRIARELHDLAAHTLAAMMLHVTGARHVLGRSPVEAEQALREAEAVGRSSMEQIRVVVAALRSTERGTDAALVSRADVTGLVEEFRRAGLAIAAEIDPGAEMVDGPLAVALHRIVGEALTNVARHSPSNTVQVRVAVCDPGSERARLRIVVRDCGRPAPPGNGSGFGLIGMGERARGFGGELRAGPTADGWEVEATLPFDPSRAVVPP
ncbi:MAG: histidine kinase [Acidimicrobiales bacterium]